MNKTTALGICFAMLAAIAGCKKQDFETAKLRCKMDGKEYVAAKELTTAQFTAPNQIRIRGTKLKNVFKPSEPFGELELKFSFDPSDLSQPILLGYSSVYYGNNGKDKTYRSSQSNPGTLFLTEFNQSTRKLSGTFTLVAEEDGGGKIVITEGGFNLEYD